MCIICNCDETGEAFLIAFEGARTNMQAARDHMLECSRVAIDQDVRKQYDATHKQMVRLIREWNSLEQQREQHD